VGRSVCLDFKGVGRSIIIARASPGQTMWGGQYRWGVGRGVPSQVGDRVRRYNLKLISTLHNDSIPETPWGKSGVDVFTPIHPVAMPLDLVRGTVADRRLQLRAAWTISESSFIRNLRNHGAVCVWSPRAVQTSLFTNLLAKLENSLWRPTYACRPISAAAASPPEADIEDSLTWMYVVVVVGSRKAERVRTDPSEDRPIRDSTVPRPEPAVRVGSGRSKAAAVPEDRASTILPLRVILGTPVQPRGEFKAPRC